jgi:ABC-type uncharacterized transport system involved in gliding motility auxiliary subunit
MGVNVWERRLAAACGLAGVAALVVAGAIVIIDRRIDSGAINFLIAGGALIIAYGILDRSALSQLMSSRKAQFGSMSVVVSTLVIGLLVMLNVLASQGDQLVDLSRARYNTLAPQSVQVTKKLDADLNTVGFYTAEQSGVKRSVSDLLDLYKAQNPHFKVRFDDPRANPAGARRYGVSLNGTLVLDYKGRVELLTMGSQSEADITAAILKLESIRTPVMCWGVGQRQRDYKDTNQIVGYSSAATQIGRGNFQIRELQLSQPSTIPADCDLVAVVGPQSPLGGQAVKALQDYLAGGGRLLVTVDPLIDGQDRSAPTLGSVNAVLKPYGIAFGGGLIGEPDPAQAIQDDPTTPVIVHYGTSPITKDLNNANTFFPQSTSIQATPPAGVTYQRLAATSISSYEMPPPPREDVKRQQGDRSGPFTVMASVEQVSAPKKTRIVAVGTSAFAENRVFASADANPQLLINSLDWLTEQEQLISVAPRPPRQVQLVLTEQQLGVNIFITLFAMPLVLVLGGVAVWWRRRRTVYS